MTHLGMRCSCLFILVLLTTGCTLDGVSTAPTEAPIEHIRSSDGMEMVHVAGGSFVLSERGSGGQGAHQVHVSCPKPVRSPCQHD